jgi:hypothetical protein
MTSVAGMRVLSTLKSRLSFIVIFLGSSGWKLSVASPRPGDHLRVVRFECCYSPHADMCGCGNEAVQSTPPAACLLLSCDHIVTAVRGLQHVNSYSAK